MARYWVKLGALAIATSRVAGASAAENEWAGYISIEPRYFFEDPAYPGQPEAGLSPAVVFAPEFHRSWADGDDRFSISLHARWDADDRNRTEIDIREAYWIHYREPWTLQVGIGHVFWGVTESRHLVDIINQIDWAGDIVGEEKLGQAMILSQWSTARMGTFELYVLPGFRERSFPSPDARLRGSFPIDVDRVEYESSEKDGRIDFAARWSKVLEGWDLGFSAFHGTEREPRLLLRTDADGSPVLVPRYKVITQVSTDIQYTHDAWILKLEALRRTDQSETTSAFVAGIEYTFFDLGKNDTSLGLLLEYLRDDRKLAISSTIYDDAIFAGLRVGLNNINDTTFLAGAIISAEGNFSRVEAATRLAESWRFEIELRHFDDIARDRRLLSGFRKDSFLTLRIARYW